MVLAGALAIVSSLYGDVDLADTVVLGTTLAALALGLVPFAVTLVQMRVFYAMKDARTPTIINAIMVAVRVPLLIASAAPGRRADHSRPGDRDLGVLPGRGHRRRDLAARPVRADGHPAHPGHAAEDDGRRCRRGGRRAAGRQPAAAPARSRTSATRCVEILLCGTVGLLVIAAVAVLLKVDELVPLRRRIVGACCSSSARGPPPRQPRRLRRRPATR